jgi:hypothetical protein
VNFPTTPTKSITQTTTLVADSGLTLPTFPETVSMGSNETASSLHANATESDGNNTSMAANVPTSSSTGAIIGGVVGGSAAVALLIAIVCIVRSRERSLSRAQGNSGIVANSGHHQMPVVPVVPNSQITSSTDSSYVDGNVPDFSHTNYQAFTGDIYANGDVNTNVVYDTAMV